MIGKQGIYVCVNLFPHSFHLDLTLHVCKGLRSLETLLSGSLCRGQGKISPL